MGAILAWFGRGLGLQIFTSLGIGLATFTGITAVVNSYLSSFDQAAGQLPPVAASLLSLAGVDVALSMCLGALVAGVSLKSLTANIVKA